MLVIGCWYWWSWACPCVPQRPSPSLLPPAPPTRSKRWQGPTNGLLFPHLSGEANLRYGERLLPVSQRRVPFARVVDLLRLQPLLARKPTSLSGGERQRLALGRALLASPRLLLLDEPLNAVDRPHRAEILAGLIAVRDELAIPMLYVSHDLGDVLRLTDDLLVLDQGRCLAQGGLAAVARNPAAAALLMDPVVTARWPLAVDPRTGM